MPGGYYANVPSSCTVPSCLHSSGSSYGFPVGSLGNLGSYGGSYGGGVSASSLAIAPGASVGYMNQLPPSQIVVQPSPVHLTVPGCILSATCEPCRVEGTTACIDGSGYGRLSPRVCSYPL